MSGAKSVVHVAVEVGQKKSFASALDWPGWARSGKDEARRDRDVARLRRALSGRHRSGGHRVPTRARSTSSSDSPGSATTDFGAPGAIAERERRALAASEAERMASLVSACVGRVRRRRRRGAGRAPQGPTGRRSGSRQDGAARRRRRAVVCPQARARQAEAATRPPRRHRRRDQASGRARRRGRCATPPAGSPGTSSITPGRSRTAASGDPDGRRSPARLVQAVTVIVPVIDGVHVAMERERAGLGERELERAAAVDGSGVERSVVSGERVRGAVVVAHDDRRADRHRDVLAEREPGDHDLGAAGGGVAAAGGVGRGRGRLALGRSVVASPGAGGGGRGSGRLGGGRFGRRGAGRLCVVVTARGEDEGDGRDSGEGSTFHVHDPTVRSEPAGGSRAIAAKATAAAAATLSESTSDTIGILTSVEAACRAARLRPGPSAPSSSASRSGTGIVQRSVASRRGVSAHMSKPASRIVVERGLPVRGPGDGKEQDLAHAHPHGPAVVRIDARRVEHECVDSERPRRSGDRAEVLGVVEPLEHGDAPGGPEQDCRATAAAFGRPTRPRPDGCRSRRSPSARRSRRRRRVAGARRGAEPAVRTSATRPGPNAGGDPTGAAARSPPGPRR